MLVNAAAFPGPAIWQGAMLCAMPLYAWAAFRNEGRHYNVATGAYIAFGAAMFVLIALQ